MELRSFIEFAEKADLILAGERFDAFEAFTELHSLDINLETLTLFDEAFRGAWDSVGDYAREFVEELGYTEAVPELLLNYIDYERLGRDLEISGCFESINAPQHQVFIFGA